MTPDIPTLAERYYRLFDIAPGQNIYLGKHLADISKYQFSECRVSTDNFNALPYDLIIESDVSKSLELVGKCGLNKYLTTNGSALFQVSRSSSQKSGWMRKLITKCSKQKNSRSTRITLPSDAALLHYFALSVGPGLENPNYLVLLSCKVTNGELYIARESGNCSDSIALLATTNDAPFSHMLCGLTGSTKLSATDNTINSIMFRERGSLIVEIKDGSNRYYISRSSLTDEGERNIAKNHNIIESLHNNPTIPLKTKQLIPKPVAKTCNTTIEEKKTGQLAWKIIRDRPDLESSLLSQAWEFSASLCVGTGRTEMIDNDKFDAIAGNDLIYLQQFCDNHNEVTKLLVLVNNYLLKQLLNNKMTIVFGHGDFGYGNILYDSSTDSLAGIIDWDTARNIELPGVDFINLLIQKFRTHNRMDKSYQAALRWLTSDQPLPTKIREQMHDKFGITEKTLKIYSLVAILHLMGRDFRFRALGSLRSEEKDTIMLIASSIEQNSP